MNTTRTTLLILIVLVLSLVFANIGYASQPNSAGVVVTIPKIGVISSVIYAPIENVNGQPQWVYDPWETQIGHFGGTADFGAGNTMIGAHSTMPDGSAGLFYHLDEVEVGDEVILSIDGNFQNYVVTQTFVVSVRDVSIAHQDQGTRLTIITCDVSDPNQRIVVIAEPV